MKETLNTAYREGKLVAICLRKINWDTRIIGYIKAIKNSLLTLQVVDQFGEIYDTRDVAISQIVSLAVNDIYNKSLERLKDHAKSINSLKPLYYYNRGGRFVGKLEVLRLNKLVCTIFFEDQYVTGVITFINDDIVKIKNVSYLGNSDGQSMYKINAITKIRYNGPLEGKIKFLCKL